MPSFWTLSEVVVFISILYIPIGKVIFEPFFYIILLPIKSHYVLKLFSFAGRVVAYNYIKGVESTYYLVAASEFEIGSAKPLNFIFVNVNSLFTLFILRAELESIFICTEFASIYNPRLFEPK